MPAASTATAASAGSDATTASAVRLDVAWLAAGACTLAGLVLFWLTTGVGGGDAALYLVYVGGLFVLPGILIAALLDRRPLGLGHVCVGIPLGFVQAMLAFICLAQVGLRGLAPWEPLVAAAVAAAVLVRRRVAFRSISLTTRFRWDAMLVTAVALVSAGLMVSRNIDTHPLPAQITSSGASYYTDIPWHIGNMAELKEYWPPRDLRVLGKPFKYYIGDYLQGADTSIATGIQPDSLVLRFDPLLQLVVIAFQLFWVGRVLGRRARTGVVAASFTLLVGDFSSVKDSTDSLFFNGFLREMFVSPTYLMGLVFFVPLLGVLAEWLRRPTRFRSGRFVALSLLTLGGGLSKATMLPLLFAGGLGLVAYEVINHRRFIRAGLALAGLAVFAYLLLSPLMRWSGQDSSLAYHPFARALQTGAAALLTGTFVGRAPHSDLVIALLVVLGTAPALLIAAGSYLVVRRGRLAAAEAAFAMVAVTGIAVILVVVGVGGGELYLWYYGYVALALLAACGVDSLLDARRSWLRNIALASIAVGVGFGLFSTVLQAGADARRIVARVVPGVPGPFVYVQPTPTELTAPVVQGLVWLREHSPAHSVIAVNNHSRLISSSDGLNFNYSALSQRQFLLEGYGYTSGFLAPRSAEAEVELQARLGLLDRIYSRGDAAAIKEAHRRFGVSYLLVDERGGLPHHALPASVTRLVFAGLYFRIYAVTA